MDHRSKLAVTVGRNGQHLIVIIAAQQFDIPDGCLPGEVGGIIGPQSIRADEQRFHQTRTIRCDREVDIVFTRAIRTRWIWGAGNFNFYPTLKGLLAVGNESGSSMGRKIELARSRFWMRFIGLISVTCQPTP